jgi:DNA-binding Lrp family transcriptional regulator
MHGTTILSAPAAVIFQAGAAAGRRAAPGMTASRTAVYIGPDAAEPPMIPFFVQIKCQLGKSYEVANKLADAEIASEIYSTAGDFDLLVKFYVEPSTDIGHFIAEKVQTLPGVADTRTIITFKAFGAS